MTAVDLMTVVDPITAFRTGATQSFRFDERTIR